MANPAGWTPESAPTPAPCWLSLEAEKEVWNLQPSSNQGSMGWVSSGHEYNLLGGMYFLGKKK